MLPILATKLFPPTTRQQIVPRPHLTNRATQGLHGKLTLVSAPAGFGKTSLVSQWITGIDTERPVTWLSLDEQDSDLPRFLTYLIGALRQISPDIGKTALGMLQAPQVPPIEMLLTTIVNELAAVTSPFALVLDDYHLIENQQIDAGLNFLLEHMPPQMHLIITTREDPSLPLPRLRARGELTEIRARDLRFTAEEVTQFLNQVMGLELTPTEIGALEERTEGWIAGLQLAALSMRGQQDKHAFIESFTGSHRFVLDYLLEEVLAHQPEHIQQFLLKTSILGRLSSSLCESVIGGTAVSGQEMLNQLEQGNLFLIPLDQERQWYRYHHLFGDLLQQQLQQRAANQPDLLTELHLAASEWFETNGYEIEAFHHATAGQDLERIKRLIEGNGVPLQFRGGARPILNWIDSLGIEKLDEHPLLWITRGSCLLTLGQVVGVAEACNAAEKQIDHQAEDPETRDMIGRIASMRTTIAVTQHQPEEIVTQANRALHYLKPENYSVRSALTWMLGYAYQLGGLRTAALEAYTESAKACRAIGHDVIAMMATMAQGDIQLANHQLHLAKETFADALAILEEPPPPASEAYLGMARIAYEWNDLDEAEALLHTAAELAHLIANTDRSVACAIFDARIKYARHDFNGATALLTQAEQIAQKHQYKEQLEKIGSLKIHIALAQGDLGTAVRVVSTQDNLFDKARVLIAQKRHEEAIKLLGPAYEQAADREWPNDMLKTALLLAQANAQTPKQANEWLHHAVQLAEPNKLIRSFIDEGEALLDLMRQHVYATPYKTYVEQVLSAMPAPNTESKGIETLVEPLTTRELEILRLVAEGLSNQEISERLYLALSTVKGHNRNIYGKLQVQRRTEAVARARELGLVDQ